MNPLPELLLLRSRDRQREPASTPNAPRSRTCLYSAPLKMLVFFSWLFSSCVEECDTYKTPWQTATQLVSSPETFDQYVQDHKSEFKAEFTNCMTNRIAAIEKTMAEEEESCARIAGADPDLFRICLDGIDDKYGYTYRILVIMDAVVKGQLVFANSVTGQDLMYLKASEPEFYQEISNMIKTSAPNPWFVCETCDKKFLGLF